MPPQPCHRHLHSPRPRQDTATHTPRDSNLDSGNHSLSKLSTLAYPNDAPIHGLTDITSTPTSNGHWVWHPRPSLSTRHGKTHNHTARDSNLGSGNHDMSRLSALAYLNDAPIHSPTDGPLAYFKRIFGVAPSPLAHNTTTLATQTPSRPPNYGHASAVDASRSPHIHLATAPLCSTQT
jgi:hypothetical protein